MGPRPRVPQYYESYMITHGSLIYGYIVIFKSPDDFPIVGCLTSLSLSLSPSCALRVFPKYLSYIMLVLSSSSRYLLSLCCSIFVSVVASHAVFSCLFILFSKYPSDCSISATMYVTPIQFALYQYQTYTPGSDICAVKSLSWVVLLLMLTLGAFLIAVDDMLFAFFIANTNCLQYNAV